MADEKIYPTLPSAPPVPEYPPNSNDYRMKEISTYKNEIQQCIDKYEGILKKKKTAFNVLHYINTGSNGIAGILGISSVTILAIGITGIGLPIVCVGLGAASTSLITSTVLKKLHTKIKKYEKILQASKSSYLTINDIISDALIDQRINSTEFKVIQKEYENWTKNLTNIKSKYRVRVQDVDMQNQLECLTREIRNLKQR